MSFEDMLLRLIELDRSASNALDLQNWEDLKVINKEIRNLISKLENR